MKTPGFSLQNVLANRIPITAGSPFTVRHAEPEVRRSVSLLSHPTQLRFSGFHRSLSGFRPPEGGVEDRPEMNGPTQQEKP